MSQVPLSTKCFDGWVTYRLQLPILHRFNMEIIIWNYVQCSCGASYCKVVFQGLFLVLQWSVSCFFIVREPARTFCLCQHDRSFQFLKGVIWCFFKDHYYRICWHALMFKKHIILQILYIIVGPLCPASLKRFVFYKFPPSNKRSLLWLASWHSALWLAEHRKHSSEM